MKKQASKKLKSFFLFAYWHDPRWKKFVGATVKIWDLAGNLHSLGHEVTIILPKYKFNKKNQGFKVVEIPFIDLPVVRLLSFNANLLSFLIFSLFMKQKPGGVYVRRMTSVIPLIFARICKSIFFYEINDDPYHIQYHQGSKIKFSIRALLSIKIDEINLKLCDRAFVISEAIIEKIKRNNPGISTGKMYVMASGTNTQLFSPRNKYECRSELRLNSSKKYIGFAGSLLKHQGVDILIKAAPIILSIEPACIFVIIGEGPMRNIWMSQVKEMKYNKSFKFTGQIAYEQVPLWINAMDICVAPFLRTAGIRSPVKIFDYMACGKAVIASKINDTTDIFQSSEAIDIIPPENPRALAKAIIDLLGNEQRAKKMGQCGRQLVEKKYDRRLIAKKIANEAISYF